MPSIEICMKHTSTHSVIPSAIRDVEFIMATSVEMCRNIANKVDTFAYLITFSMHMWKS